jgi:hypothetical protein
MNHMYVALGKIRRIPAQREIYLRVAQAVK